MTIVKPSKIVLEYFLDSPDLVVSSGKQDLVVSIIKDNKKITSDVAETLASIFLTSQEYWENLQIQYDTF